MTLSGQQLEALHDAILAVFSKRDLTQLVKFKLDEQLEVISDGGNLSETVFSLIRWAESRGRLPELIREAHLARPHNSVLAELATEAGLPLDVDLASSNNDSTNPELDSPPNLSRSRSSIWRIVGWSITAIGLIASLITILTYCQPPVVPEIATPTPLATLMPDAGPTQFNYSVTVVDDETELPIAGAQVVIEIVGRAPLGEDADSNGFARVVVPAAFAEQPGRLIIRADGYKVWSEEIDLYPDRLPNIVKLKR